MSAPRPGQSYLSTSKSVQLHETFVRNVRARMMDLGWTDNRGGGKMGQHNEHQPSWVILAEKSGIPYRTVQNLMTLSNQPTMVGAAAIARAVGISLDKLLGQEDVFTAPSISRSSELACIHNSRHLEGKFVCQSCLTKWQDYQQRLRNLHEKRREEHREDWTAENKVVREQETAHLPPSMKENMG